MKIRYMPLLPRLASARLRAMIPGRELMRMGHDVVLEGSCDVAILQKHDWPEDFSIGAKRIIFDVCDDWFSREWGDHYRRWCARADVVTCNSRTMAEIIKRETGRDAVVIDDPYESSEKPAKAHYPLLWFGNSANLVDLAPLLPRLTLLKIISDAEHPAIERWSPEGMLRAWQDCGMVVIPTGKSMAKSANRAVEAIRNGLYPVCGHMPAYHELGLGVDDIPAEVERLMSASDTLDRIRELQDKVRERFSPQTVAQRWHECLSSI